MANIARSDEPLGRWDTGPLGLVRLTPLMQRTGGSPDVVIGLIDGPVNLSHPELNASSIRVIRGSSPGFCADTGGMVCMHGMFVAGILTAKRGSIAPAIAPDCTLIVRSIFAESARDSWQIPNATSEELAAAIIETIDAGARVLNLSVAVEWPSLKGEHSLREALDAAARRRVLVIAAAGNQETAGGSVIIRHPWVLPVVAYNQQRKPVAGSNLNRCVGIRGLGGPGVGITSLGATGKPHTSGGTSAAAPFITGAVALLWSELPSVTAEEMKFTITHVPVAKRTAVVPPLLDAWTTYQTLAGVHGTGRNS